MEQFIGRVLNTVIAAEILCMILQVSSEHKERKIGLYASTRLGFDRIRIQIACHLDKGGFLNSPGNLKIKTALNDDKDMVKMLNFLPQKKKIKKD